MGLTRFYDRVSGGDGPVSGAIQTISVGFDDVANSETVHRRVKFPAGMAFEITEINVYSGMTTCGAEIVQRYRRNRWFHEIRVDENDSHHFFFIFKFVSMVFIISIIRSDPIALKSAKPFLYISSA